MAILFEARYARTGVSVQDDAMGMREMQRRVFEVRDAPYILLKAPPAAGKSRALMFVALDKMRRQGLRKTIVAVPEHSIGASFRSTNLSAGGFPHDWTVAPAWDLCATEGATTEKIRAFRCFMESPDEIVVCTHATLRFAFEQVGVEAFDGCLVAIDEFHHVSGSEESRLGQVLRALLARGKAHLLAMTGSYFRGDGIPVLSPDEEARFTAVSYSYYEQLNGYRHLKALGIDFTFYEGRYLDGFARAFDPGRKTIIHIPSVNSAEGAFDNKISQVWHLYDRMGEFIGPDPEGILSLVRRQDGGGILRIADLVDDTDGGVRRNKVLAALARHKDERDYVDIIVALGMAKEGFDWVWCERALTIGYRSSMTEIIQIIGRTTRDAPGKPRAHFTNLVAAPENGDAGSVAVRNAVNDILKAIAGALLMEQVLAPPLRFEAAGTEGPGVRQDPSGAVVVRVGGLANPPTARVAALLRTDMADLIATITQRCTDNSKVLSPDMAPAALHQIAIAEIVSSRYGDRLSDEEKECMRQHATAQMVLPSLLATAAAKRQGPKDPDAKDAPKIIDASQRLAEITGMLDVRHLDLNLLESHNPFQETFTLMGKTLDPKTLSKIQAAIIAQRTSVTEEEALALYPRLKRFAEQEGRHPNPHANDPLERHLAEAQAKLRQMKEAHDRAQKARDATTDP